MKVSNRKSIEKVIQQIEEGHIKINDKNKEGYTVLMYACISNYTDLVRKLIRMGADINAINKFNETVLTCSIYYCRNKPDINDSIQILLDAGVNVNNSVGISALSQALNMNNRDLVIKLVKLGSDINVNELNAVIHDHDLALLKIFIKAGADININKKDTQLGYTPLMMALLPNQPNLNIIKELLKAGADITIKDNRNKTAIDIAEGHTKDFLMSYLSAIYSTVQNKRTRGKGLTYDMTRKLSSFLAYGKKSRKSSKRRSRK